MVIAKVDVVADVAVLIEEDATALENEEVVEIVAVVSWVDGRKAIEQH